MAESVSSAIKSRKSVRTFNGEPLRAADREKLAAYIADVPNPFGVSVRFRLLDAKENGLSSPVIVGAQTYLAAKVKRAPNFEAAFGYSFEKACLYAHMLGVGTVMLAASLSRAAFEAAMDVQEDEVMPVASPVGYPAKKRSVRETLMRRGLKADERLPFAALFFENGFTQPLAADSAFAEALAMVRLAPSATNRQPWRAVVCGNTVHFYEHKTLKDSSLGDVQLVDMGIALAHFDLTVRENGIAGKFIDAEPSFAAPDRTRYVISFERTV